MGLLHGVGSGQSSMSSLSLAPCTLVLLVGPGAGNPWVDPLLGRLVGPGAVSPHHPLSRSLPGLQPAGAGPFLLLSASMRVDPVGVTRVTRAGVTRADPQVEPLVTSLSP